MKKTLNLNEMNRKQILQAVDPNFIHHAVHTKELPELNYTGVKYMGLVFTAYKGKAQYQLNFHANSATTPGDKLHRQSVVLLGLRDFLKAQSPEAPKKQEPAVKPKPGEKPIPKAPAKKEPPKMLLRDMVLKSISEKDILINCTCEAFLYFGYKWICTQKGIIIPRDNERRPPNIRNPKRRGIICKHLDNVLKVLPFNSASIVSDVKKNELEK